MNWTGMTFFERIRFIAEHGARIYVRAEVDGKWQSLSLAEVSDPMLISELVRLACRPVEPTRVID